MGNLLFTDEQSKQMRYEGVRRYWRSRRFQKVGLEPCNAGIDSRQFEELTTCNPGGNDSPKLRTASARSGGTYCRQKLDGFFGGSKGRQPRDRLLTKRIVDIARAIVGASREQQDGGLCRRSERGQGQAGHVNHSPAVSAATTECSGPYSGMRAPSRRATTAKLHHPVVF